MTRTIKDLRPDAVGTIHNMSDLKDGPVIRAQFVGADDTPGAALPLIFNQLDPGYGVQGGRFRGHIANRAYDHLFVV